jgi:hypothetical protein
VSAFSCARLSLCAGHGRAASALPVSACLPPRASHHGLLTVELEPFACPRAAHRTWGTRGDLAHRWSPGRSALPRHVHELADRRPNSVGDRRIIHEPSDKTNLVSVSYFKGFTDNTSPVGVTSFSIPPDFTVDFGSRDLPGEVTVVNSVCNPELVLRRPGPSSARGGRRSVSAAAFTTHGRRPGYGAVVDHGLEDRPLRTREQGGLTPAVRERLSGPRRSCGVGGLRG